MNYTIIIEKPKTKNNDFIPPAAVKTPLKLRFNADSAEEYFTDLRQFYIKSAGEIFDKDNADRNDFPPIYSAEYISMKGRIKAMNEVLEYFQKFSLESDERPRRSNTE